MGETLVSLLLLSVPLPLPVSSPLSFPAFVLFKVVSGVLIICFSPFYFILRHSRSLIFLKTAGWGPLRVPPSLFLSLFHAFFLSLPCFYPFFMLGGSSPTLSIWELLSDTLRAAQLELLLAIFGIFPVCVRDYSQSSSVSLERIGPVKFMFISNTLGNKYIIFHNSKVFTSLILSWKGML